MDCIKQCKTADRLAGAGQCPLVTRVICYYTYQLPDEGLYQTNERGGGCSIMKLGKQIRLKVKATVKYWVPIVVILAVIALSFGLPACSSSSRESLINTHLEGELEDLQIIDDSLCLSCHPEEEIIKATASLTSLGSVNIHKPPEKMMVNYGSCTSCHMLDESVTITCNKCHNFEL